MKISIENGYFHSRNAITASASVMHLRENGQMGTALRVAVRSRPALAGEYDSPHYSFNIEIDCPKLCKKRFDKDFARQAHRDKAPDIFRLPRFEDSR